MLEGYLYKLPFQQNIHTQWEENTQERRLQLLVFQILDSPVQKSPEAQRGFTAIMISLNISQKRHFAFSQTLDEDFQVIFTLGYHQSRAQMSVIIVKAEGMIYVCCWMLRVVFIFNYA